MGRNWASQTFDSRLLLIHRALKYGLILGVSRWKFDEMNSNVYCLSNELRWQLDFSKWRIPQVMFNTGIVVGNVLKESVSFEKKPLAEYDHTVEIASCWMANEGKTENKAVTSFKKLISFLFNDPLRCLPSSKVFFVPCDHILQRTHWVRYEILVQHHVLSPGQALPLKTHDSKWFQAVNTDTAGVIESVHNREGSRYVTLPW